MEPETFEKRQLSYYYQKLPYNLFAIVRLEWLDHKGNVDSVDEIPLEDEGEKTIDGFEPLIYKFLEGGADVHVMTPYPAEILGLEDA